MRCLPDTGLQHQSQTNIGCLIKLADEGRVTVYLVDITRLEIKAQIAELLEEANLRIQDFKKKASILFSVEKFRTAFNDFDGQKQGEEVWGAVEKFFVEAKVKFIEGKVASIERVFESYFGRKPPFGGGAKKSEFPDAFVIDALAQSCATSGEMIYVVSGDGDFEKACELHDKLIHLKDIQEFVALVLEADSKLADLAEAELEKRTSEIESAIKEAFVDGGFWLSDREGNVDKAVVRDTTLHEVSLVDVWEEQIGGAQATFEGRIEIEFDADVNYKDYDTSVWDHEDSRYLWLDTICETVHGKVVLIPFEVSILFDPSDKEFFDIHGLLLNNGDAIEVTLDESDDH